MLEKIKKLFTIDAPFATNMDTGLIKLIAIITMLIDHVGLVFFPKYIIFRQIGRISYPLFIYCVVVGSVYTRDIKKYALKLVIFFVISQPFYMLAFNHKLWEFNIYTTLLAGLCAIWSIRQKNWLAFILVMILSSALPLSYGIEGVFLYIIMYLARSNIIVFAVSSICYMLWWGFPGRTFFLFDLGFGIQSLSVLCLPLLLIKTKTNIKINKYFFYVFYPAHLLLIYLVKILLK